MIILLISNNLFAKEIPYTKIKNVEYLCSAFEYNDGGLEDDGKPFILTLKIFYNGTFPAKDEVSLKNEKYKRISGKFGTTHRFVNNDGIIIDINAKRNFLQVLEQIQLTKIYKIKIFNKNEKYKYKLPTTPYSLCFLKK